MLFMFLSNKTDKLFLSNKTEKHENVFLIAPFPDQSLLVPFNDRATDECSLPEIAQYSPYYLPLIVLLLPKDQAFIFYLYL